MKFSYFALAFSSACSPFALTADNIETSSSVQYGSLTQIDLDQTAEELLAPFQDGFQLEDLVAISSILDKHFSTISDFSLEDKRSAAQYVLEKLIAHRKAPGLEKQFLTLFCPALVFIVFPSSIDDLLTPPSNPTPQGDEVLKATNALIYQFEGGISWKEIPRCILSIYQFVSSYRGLDSSEKAYFSKKILGSVIDKTDTPYLPDVIFDELFKRMGYTLIDFLSQR